MSSWLVATMKVVWNRSANLRTLCATTAAVTRSSVAQNSSMKITCGCCDSASARRKRYRWPSLSCSGRRSSAKASLSPAMLSQYSDFESFACPKQSTNGLDCGSGCSFRSIIFSVV